jgi:hypothetical protein
MEDVRQDRDQGLTTAQLAGVRASAPPNGSTNAPSPKPTPPKPNGEQTARLLGSEESDNLRREWDGIQAGFVDEPRHAVEQADNLVAETMKRLAEMFSAERSKLESQWDRGDDVSTEDLRVALQRYRSFFQRLLSV